MGEIEIIRDVDYFDERMNNMSEHEKKILLDRIFFTCKIARKLYNEGKISKITFNRVRTLWNWSPNCRPIVSTKDFNKLLGFKEPNLIFIQNALNKVFSILKTENYSQNVHKTNDRDDQEATHD